MQKTYSTKGLAIIVGVHVNTLRFYNHDGLFSIDPVKGIDDRESGYDDSQERRELEKVADMLFG